MNSYVETRVDAPAGSGWTTDRTALHPGGQAPLAAPHQGSGLPALGTAPAIRSAMTAEERRVTGSTGQSAFRERVVLATVRTDVPASMGGGLPRAWSPPV